MFPQSVIESFLPIVAFVVTTQVFTNHAKKANNKNDEQESKTDNGTETKVSTCESPISYEEVIRLRKKYYSSSVSVSYSNSGPLMIVGVSFLLWNFSKLHYMTSKKLIGQLHNTNVSKGIWM